MISSLFIIICIKLHLYFVGYYSPLGPLNSNEDPSKIYCINTNLSNSKPPYIIIIKFSNNTPYNFPITKHKM